MKVLSHAAITQHKCLLWDSLQRALWGLSSIVIIIAAGAYAASAAWAQTESEKKPAFEVASVKASEPCVERIMLTPRKSIGTGSKPISYQPGGRFSGCQPLISFITNAYDIESWQIAGWPDWISKTWFSIEARAGSEAGKDRMRLMLQSLLEERFKLKIHRTREDMDSYSLMVMPGGPKLENAKDENGNPIAIMPTPEELHKRWLDAVKSGNAESAMKKGMWMSGDGSRMEFVYNPATLKMLAGYLSGQVGRPVTDKTGIPGIFNIQLRYATGRPKFQVTLGSNGAPVAAPAAAEASEPAGPTIFKALQEQLGLKLESDYASIDRFIIDSIEKPSEN